MEIFANIIAVMLVTTTTIGVVVVVIAGVYMVYKFLKDE